MSLRPRGALCALCPWLAALALLAPRSLSAQTWTGATSGVFSTASNWSGNAVPASDGGAALVFGSASNYTVTLGSSWSVNSLSFISGATSAYFLTGSGSPTLTIGSGGISDSTGLGLSFSGLTMALPQAITYYISSGTDTPSSISGSGGITKTGAGTLRLSANNSSSGWTGPLTISAGTVVITRDTQLGVVPSSATAGMITLNGGTLSFGMLTTVNSNRGIAVTAASTIAASGGATYGGIITGSADLTVTGGPVTLSGANTYSGTITIGGGQLKIASATTVQNATIAATSAPLTFGTNSATLGALSGSSAISLANGSNPVALTVGYNNASTLYSGVLSSSGSLIKTGTGTFTLSGASTYAGSTIVSAGTLLVSGSLGGSGTVSVYSGATLAGAGTIAGATIVGSGGVIAPGNNGVGTLTFTQGLSLNAGSILNFELGATSDQIRVSGGTLTGPGTAGGVTLNLANAGSFAAGTYTLFDFTSAATTGFDATSFTVGTGIAGYDYSFAVSGSTLQLTATASAIPEPATYAALVGLVALAASVLRKRRLATLPV